MLTLSPPPFFPNFAWPLEDPNIISHEFTDTFFDNISVETSDSLLPSPQSTHLQSTNFKTINAGGETVGIVKKLNHNASERDRRKKINNLYSSLFSLLPESDRMKKLSIPATVSCVVKYIPELQKEVEKLVRKKEELSTRMCRQREDDDNYVDAEYDQLNNKRRKMGIRKDSSLSLSSAVTISPVGAKQVIVQISALKAHKGLLSEALNKLELDDGLFLLNASSFQSIGDKVFHNLHFQAQGQFELELQLIKEKILSLYEKINSKELFC